jgi:TP901 family phage tail tape measure protein
MSTATIAINILGNAQSLERALNGAKEKLQSFGDSVTGIGQKMSLAVTAPIVGMGAVALNSAGTFEQAMNTIAVVAGATEGDLQALQAEALRLGAVTSFSAGDAAQAMVELGKAGFDASQTMASIGGVLDLAAASGMSLDQAASLTAKTLKAFNMDASASGEVANMLAAAAVSSAADISDLGMGMQMSSAVANTFGQSLGTTTAALALLNDNALRGSDAGTSLKTAMMRLYAPTDEAAGIMQQLGISAYDAEGKARPLFDVINDMRSSLYGLNEVTVVSGGRTQEQADRMADLQKRIQGVNTKLSDYASGIAGVAQSENDKIVAVDRLNRELAAMQAEYNSLAGIQGTATTVMKEYTEAERNAMLSTLGGADAVRALSILLNQSEEDIAAMVGAVGEQGAAAAMAGAKMDGLKGAIEYFKGSLESTLIAAVYPFLGGISDMIRQAADLISSFTNLSPAMQRVILLLTGVVAAIGPGLMAVGTFAKMLAWLAGPVIGGLSAALAALTSPVVLVIGAIVALGAAIWYLDLGGVQGKIAAISEAFGSWLANAESVKGNIAAIWETFQQFMAGEISFGDLGATMGEEIAKMGETLKALFTGDAFEQLKKDVVAALDLQSIADSIQFALNGFEWSADGFSALRTKLAMAATMAVNSIDWKAAGLSVQSFIDSITGYINEIDWAGAGFSFGNFVKSIVDGIGALFGESSTPEGEAFAFNGLRMSIEQAITDLDFASIGESFVGLRDAILGAITGLWAGFNEGAGLTDAMAGLWTQIDTTMQGLDQRIVDGVAGAISAVDWTAASWDFVAMVDSLGEKIKTMDWSALGKNMVSALASMIGGSGEEGGGGISWGGFTAAVRNAITSIKWDMIGGAFNDLGSAVLKALQDMIAGIIAELGNVTGIGAAVEGAQEAVGEAGQAVNDAIGGAGQAWNDLFGGNRLGTSFAPGGLTLVGENGPELVGLPRGSQVYNNREMQGMLTGNPVSVTVHATVTNDVDIERLAYRIKQVIDRNG